MTTFSRATRIGVVAAVAAGVAAYGVSQSRKSTNLQTSSTSSSSGNSNDNSNNLTKLQWNGFTELKLAKSEQISPNVKRLTFSLPTETTITGLQPVSSLITQHTPDNAWLPVFRPYTPISSPTQPGTLEFLIKKYPGGRASGKMHSLSAGDTMKFRPLPAVEFAYTANQHSDILMIAGGSGITPIWQLLNVILENPADTTKIALVYANNSEDDILLRKDIEALEHKYPGRFRKVFTVSHSGSSSSSSSSSSGGGGGGDGDLHQGYVSQAVIRKVWPAQRQDGQKVLVSGPPAMVDSVAGKKGLIGWTQGSVGGILAELGYKDGDVHKF